MGTDVVVPVTRRLDGAAGGRGHGVGCHRGRVVVREVVQGDGTVTELLKLKRLLLPP